MLIFDRYLSKLKNGLPKLMKYLKVDTKKLRTIKYNQNIFVRSNVA